jgi:3-phytase
MGVYIVERGRPQGRPADRAGGTMTHNLVRVAASMMLVVGALSCAGTVKVTGDYPVVQSTVTTGPCHSPGDACDDTAIWIHPTDPNQSVVIGDDKDGGMVLWNLQGSEIQFLDGDTKMNNVDLRYNFPLAGTFSTDQTHTHVALVGVTNETDSGVTLYKVNPYSTPPGKLEHANGTLPASTLPLGKPLVYGGCMYYSQPTGTYYFFANWKDGTVMQVQLTGGTSVTAKPVRTFDVGGQVEGCVADDVHQAFYIGEEDRASGSTGRAGFGDSRTEVDRSLGHWPEGGRRGLTLYYRSDGDGYLIASGQSEGTDAETSFTRGMVPTHGRGRSASGRGRDGRNGRHELPARTGLPHGVFVTHDAVPIPSRHRLTPFDRIATALKLTMDSTWDPRCSPYGTCAGSTP